VNREQRRWRDDHPAVSGGPPAPQAAPDGLPQPQEGVTAAILGRVAWFDGEVTVQRSPAPDGLPAVVVRAEHATGSTVLLLTPDLARTVGDMLLRAATGVIIARN
jgi:hypothetical protein